MVTRSQRHKQEIQGPFTPPVPPVVPTIVINTLSPANGPANTTMGFSVLGVGLLPGDEIVFGGIIHQSEYIFGGQINTAQNDPVVTGVARSVPVYVKRGAEISNTLQFTVYSAASNITFRASTLTAYSQKPETSIDKPAGTAQGDIIAIGFLAGRGGTVPDAIIPPAGFTQVGVKVDHNIGGFAASFSVWVKRAGASEPLGYLFDHGGVIYTTQAVTLSYSDANPAAGSPIDVFSQNGSDAALVATGLSVSPSLPNEMLVWLGHNWDGSGTLAPPAPGMTERHDAVVYAADQKLTVSGATGNRTQTQVGNNPWTTFLLALKPGPGG